MSRNRRFTVASQAGGLPPRAGATTATSTTSCWLVIAGALRNWLMSRGEPVTPTTTVRAMAPMSVYPDADLDSTGPVRRSARCRRSWSTCRSGRATRWCGCRQIAHATESHPTAASLVDARTIVTLSGFAPPTLHAMGIRVATTFSARQFNLLITNVPGAQKQMYVAGTKLLETYAVPPLLNNQVLAIGVTSYNGMLYFGINADRDAMSDVDVLPSLLRESLDELLEAARGIAAELAPELRFWR